MSNLEPLPYVHHPSGMRCSAIRYAECSPPQPMGCRWCGLTSTGHARQWSRSVGTHTWVPPTAAQIRQRMQARRKAAQAAAPVVAPVVEPVECDAMAHNSIGSEVFCTNPDPVHVCDHEDGDGYAWPVLAEEREFDTTVWYRDRDGAWWMPVDIVDGQLRFLCWSDSDNLVMSTSEVESEFGPLTPSEFSWKTPLADLPAAAL